MNRPYVLVVDDNPELGENLHEILHSADDLDVDVAVATTVEDALREASSHEISVAIVDVHLPDGDGFALIQKLREGHVFIEVVILTGDATIDTAAAAVREGAYSYVSKPFDAEQLVATVKRAVESAQLKRERYALTEALARSEERHREVVENVPACIAALDEVGRIVLWNRELEKTSGFSRAEMVGTDGRGLFAEGDRRLATKDGGHRLVRWRATAVPDGVEGTFELYAMGVDVTEEREQLRRRTMAERLAAVGTLAAGLAHEVRNPLNSASLQLQVLARRLERGETDVARLQPTVEIVRAEIERLERLVHEFLDFARPADLVLNPVDANELLKRVVELVRPQAVRDGVELMLDPDPEIGSIVADSEKLLQVLLNLVRNAIEALNGAGRCILRSKRADDRGFVRLEVDDDGPGFPSDAPVFDAFFTSKEGGTGLGLAIAHEIAGKHGGALCFETRPGRTVFTLELPQFGRAGRLLPDDSRTTP